MAVLATPGALNQAETIRKAAERHRAREMDDAKAIASQIEGLNLLFERRAGETGKLYGSVTSGDIAEAILGKTGIDLDKRKVALPEPIRNLGQQVVPIKLMIDLLTNITVEVLPLGGILERERLSQTEVEAIEAEAEVATAVGAKAVAEVSVEDLLAEAEGLLEEAEAEEAVAEEESEEESKA
jgi:large subunit ribosomal protein L9